MVYMQRDREHTPTSRITYPLQHDRDDLCHVKHSRRMDASICMITSTPHSQHSPRSPTSCTRWELSPYPIVYHPMVYHTIRTTHSMITPLVVLACTVVWMHPSTLRPTAPRVHAACSVQRAAWSYTELMKEAEMYCTQRMVASYPRTQIGPNRYLI